MSNERLLTKKIKFEILVGTLFALSILFFHNRVYDLTVNGTPPGFGHVDYEGLYVVDGNKIDVIVGEFVIFGSLTVKDTATLIVYGDLSIYHSGFTGATVSNSGRLIVEGGCINALEWGRSQDSGLETVISVGELALTDRAECNISMSKFHLLKIYVGENARLHACKSHLASFHIRGNATFENCSIDWVESSRNATLNIKNSSIDTFLCDAYTVSEAPSVSIVNSSIHTLQSGPSSNISVDNSTIDWTEFDQESSSVLCLDNSNVGLSLHLTKENLIWTVKPFFAVYWNIHRDSPLRMVDGNLTLKNTNVTRIAIRFEGSSVSLVNSKLYGVACQGTRIYMLGCSIDIYLTMWDSSAYFFDSTLEVLNCYDSNTTLVDSICSQINVGGTFSFVEVWWNLKVIISDHAENPQENTIVIIYDQDLELVEKKTVSREGITQFTLLEKRVSSNKTENFANYIVYAKYGEFCIEKKISLEKSREISLMVTPFRVHLIRFLASPTGIILVMVVVTIGVVVVFKWRRVVQKIKQDVTHYEKI